MLNTEDQNAVTQQVRLALNCLRCRVELLDVRLKAAPDLHQVRFWKEELESLKGIDDHLVEAIAYL